MAHMKVDLKDKVLVVTGASAGIGKATALEAARRGMHIVLAARREDKLHDVAEEIRRIDRQALVVPTDVSKDEDVAALVEKTVERFGRLDVMCANAGYGFRASVGDLDERMHRQIFEVNYFGTVRCAQHAMPVMKKQCSGQIMIVSSIVGRIGLPMYAAYSATKAAQATLAMALRVELARFGIEVTCVYPIGTRTEFFQVSAKLNGQDTIRQNTPDMFMQTPEHVAKKMVNAMRRPKPEVWPGRFMGIASAIGLMLPRMTQRSLRRHVEDEQRRGFSGT